MYVLLILKLFFIEWNVKIIIICDWFNKCFFFFFEIFEVIKSKWKISWFLGYGSVDNIIGLFC